MLKIINTLNIIFLFFIFISCADIQSQNRYDNTIEDMRATSWLTTGDDKRMRAVEVAYFEKLLSNQQKANQAEIQHFNKMLSWAKKYEAINNMKIKYIDYNKHEIFGEGIINISTVFTTYLHYDYRLSTTGVTLSISIYNWRCYYPQQNIYRNFENEPRGNYAYTWPIIKSEISKIIWTWETEVTQ